MSQMEATWKFRKELNAGTSALMVLTLVVRSRRPMYGYEIGMELEALSTGGLPMNHGALYPVLRSLERSGLLTSEVEPSVSGPPRKYYSPTPASRRVLAEWVESWQRTRRIVDVVLREKHVSRPKNARRNSKVS